MVVTVLKDLEANVIILDIDQSLMQQVKRHSNLKDTIVRQH